MSNVDSILSKLGYPSMPKDGSSIISNVVSISKLDINSPSMSNRNNQLMENIESSFAPSISEDSPSVMNSVQLCLVDFNVSPLNIGGNPGVDGDMTALINKPYTLIVGKLNGTLQPNSILTVNGSDGTSYTINKSITNPPNSNENSYNIVLLGEVNVSSSVEQLVTYTVSNNGQSDSSNPTFKMKWVSSLPPEKLVTNPKCPIGTWSKIDITFTLNEFFNPENRIPSPAIAAYNEMTNQKINRFIGIRNTLENWGKFYLFLSTLTHGYSYNRLCNISLTPDFTSSTISPTSILKLSFVISDINLETELELKNFESYLPNNKISHKCIGDWLKANFKTISDLIYINKTNPNQQLVMSVPASCKIENFSIDVNEVTISPPSPPITPSSSSSSSNNNLMYVIIAVVILGLYFMFRPKSY